MRRNIAPKAQAGFSLLELIVAAALISILMGAVFEQINTAQQRSTAERNTLDLFEESREFMDQMGRDLRQIGYPNPRNFSSTALNSVNPANDSQAAVGLVYADQGDLWFEGGLDDSNEVLFTQYHYDSSTTGGCPCLRRSQQPKVSGLPGSETPQWQVEVQNVQNFLLSPPVPIFTYYTDGGATPFSAGSLPVQWDSPSSGTLGQYANQMATIDAIKVQIVVQSPTPDPKTGAKPIVTLVTTVKLNNCLQAATGQLSCQN